MNRTLKLMESRGVKPNNVTHNMVIQGLVVAGKTHDADAYYHERLEHDRKGSYDASFIKAYCETGRLDEAFKRFHRLNFPLPKNVYFILVNSLCASDDHIDKAQVVLKRMCKLGVEPGKSMYGIIISAWCRVRKVKNAQRNFEVLRYTRKIIPDKYTYTTMINHYCRTNRLDQATVLFQEMKKRRVIPDVATYTIFHDHRPSLHMDSEREALGIELDLHYYTVCINYECEFGKVENAEKIFRGMIESGMEADDVAYAALIGGCCRRKCEDKAQKLIQEMVEKGMTPLQPCIDVYIKLIRKMLEEETTPSKACMDLYLKLTEETVENGL